MIKKTLIISTLLASSGVLANGGSFEPAPEPEHLGACYVGAAFSGDIANFDTTSVISTTLSSSAFSSTFENSRDFDWRGRGIDGQLFVGYGMIFYDHYTLAGEAFGSVSSLKGDEDVQVFSSSNPTPVTNRASIEMNHTLGVALLPGIKLTDTAGLYLRFGYVNSQFEFNDDGVFTNLKSRFDKSDNEQGVQVGGGIEVMLSSNVGLRGEYTWEKYGSMKFTKTETIPNNGFTSAETDIVRVKSTVNTVNLGLDYHFYL